MSRNNRTWSKKRAKKQQRQFFEESTAGKSCSSRRGNDAARSGVITTVRKSLFLFGQGGCPIGNDTNVNAKYRNNNKVGEDYGEYNTYDIEPNTAFHHLRDGDVP